MPSKTFEIPVYSPGKKVELYTGEILTIEHVHIRGYSLAVKVLERKDLVPVEYLRLKSDIFMLNQA